MKDDMSFEDRTAFYESQRGEQKAERQSRSHVWLYVLWLVVGIAAGWAARGIW